MYIFVYRKKKKIEKLKEKSPNDFHFTVISFFFSNN